MSSTAAPRTPAQEALSHRMRGKAVLVTGGTSGIGLAAARRLAAEGAAVAVAGRRKDVGEQVAADLRAGGAQAVFVAADFTVEAEAEAAVAAAVAEFGRLDAAFNNAGGVNAGGPVETIPAEGWHAEITHNLTTVFHGMK
jgi:NAD(P)-dependent dehydrogenase (short-subunit alcohol dehydrogenase family)